jgi:hypothetical protein
MRVRLTNYFWHQKSLPKPFVAYKFFHLTAFRPR